MKSLLEEFALEEHFRFGQDSGAMIARRLCLLDGRRVRRLVMTNTEVPAHRPGWSSTDSRPRGITGRGGRVMRTSDGNCCVWNAKRFYVRG